MPRTLFLDVTQGGTAGDVLAALVDLGVAPSPILHALGSLEWPAHLVIEAAPGGQLVRADPGEAPMHVRPRELTAELTRSDVPADAARIGGDAIGRLIAATSVPEEGACVLRHAADAGTLLSILGASMAARTLAPDVIVASRVPVDADPPHAIVELLASVADALDFDAPASVSDDAAALLRALCDEPNIGVPEPAWPAVVSRGAGGRVRVALGDV